MSHGGRRIVARLEELGSDRVEVPTGSAATAARRRLLQLRDRGQLTGLLLLDFTPIDRLQFFLVLALLVLFEEDLANSHDFGLRAQVLPNVLTRLYGLLAWARHRLLVMMMVVNLRRRLEGGLGEHVVAAKHGCVGPRDAALPLLGADPGPTRRRRRVQYVGA